eukprot:maker-scaffold273_size229271-snap-gene-1.19 protein:Tk00745 transcript:maker-scaffold273_size229271-snap-gene-1.19-mRNA-1 annotation:"hypothetical protein DAPPUDRAFT_31637"
MGALIRCWLVLVLALALIWSVNALNRTGNRYKEPPIDDDFEGFFVHRVIHFKDSAAEEAERRKEANITKIKKITPPPYIKSSKFAGWPQYPLFIMVIGGLRWDFVKKYPKLMTSFQYLKKHGSFVPSVIPVFPPEDYPTWSSIATGKYPEAHNIVGDVMYNLRKRNFFHRFDHNSTRDPVWWQGMDPFWSTAAKHGRKVAMFNWHDCTLSGRRLERPEDCRPFRLSEDNFPSKQRIAADFDVAFNRLYMKKYDVAVVYTDLLRRVGELQGEDSPAMKKALRDIDDIIQAKLTDIRSKEERAGIKMNLMVISDYGFTDITYLEPVLLDQYLDMDLIQFIILSSGYAQIIPYALEQYKILHNCQSIEYGVDVFMASQLQDPPILDVRIVPDDLHYGTGEWTQDVLLVAHPAYQLVFNSSDPKVIVVPGSGALDDEYMIRSGFNPSPVKPKYPKMTKKMKVGKEPKPKAILDALQRWEEYHGHYRDMHTTAAFLGPDFERNHINYKPVEIVDFYQIMCMLLRIPPDIHAGSWDRVKNMLKVSSGNSLADPIATTCFMAMVTMGVTRLFGSS